MAVGVDMDGIKHILGLWIADTEGASFWAAVCADLANRGVQDVFIVCCDGLKRFARCCLGHLAEFHGANLHRPFDQSSKQVGFLPGPQSSLECASQDLHRIKCRYCRCCNSMRLSLQNSGVNTRSRSKCGAMRGNGSYHFCNSCPRQDECSTPRTQSSRLMPGCVKPLVIGDNSLMIRPR